MKSLMIAAMQSGAGKTIMTCALLAALKHHGFRVCAFKSGPDYIDPMFHRRVLDVPCRNLDLFLQGQEGVRRSFSRTTGDVAVLEAAMGYYDGLSDGAEASAWALTETLRIPAVLVLRPQGSNLTLAAQVCGMKNFRPNSRISGLLLNNCKPERFGRLSAMLERECSLPVLGYLPPMQEAEIGSRHLGLLTASEVTDFQSRISAVAGQFEQSVDLNRLLSLAAELPDPERIWHEPSVSRCRIAVARDDAFCFLYEDNLDALWEAGADLVFFSPLRDCALPDADGLYLCGGYPELYAAALSGNSVMRTAVSRAVRGGMPTVAECGGFLYLQQCLSGSDGLTHSMCGVLPGSSFPTGGLRRFGYVTLYAEKDSLLFRSGEKVPAHEFHHWDSTEPGDALYAEKNDGRCWRCGFVSPTLYAAFPHLHFGGGLPLAARFVEACMHHE